MSSHNNIPVSPARSPRGSGGGGLAAALSLGLHGILVAMLIHAAASPGTLGPPDSISVAIVQAAAPQPIAEAEPQPDPPPKPKPQPRPFSNPKPVAAPTPALPEPPKAGAEPDTATAMIAAPPQPSSPPSGQDGGNVAPDDSLRLYGQIVWARIAARKPRGARLPGTATVTFAIAPDGGLIAAEVTASSGSATLDRMAQAAVRDAAPFPPPPPRATPAQLIFSVPFQVR